MPLVRKPPPGVADSPTRATLTEALKSGAGEQRMAAARSLGQQPGSAAVLGAALREERDHRVREAIFTSLTRLGGAESVEIAIHSLRSDDANLRTGALDTLRMLIRVVRPRLPDLLRDADPDIRVLSCDLVRELPTVEATKLLGPVLDQDPDANVCAGAIDVLAEIGETDALPFIDRCAARFPQNAFLRFAIGVAAQRITAGRG